MKKFFVLITAVIAFASCEKNPGEGGTSTIKGVVMVQEYNKDLTIKVGVPHPAQEVDVYIIYGNDEVYGDKFQTGFDGKYEFDYLQDGKYTIYTLSKSISNRLTKELYPIVEEVEITGKNQTIEVDTLNILD
jgi:hypothetical protein